MRFYFGFSKKIPLKWIVTAILGILAFFGLTKVHAMELSDLNYSRSFLLGNEYNISISCNVPTQSFIWSFDNPISITNDNEYIIFLYSNMFSSSTGQYSLIDYGPGAFELVRTNGSTRLCDFKDGYIICPVNKGETYDRLKLNFLNVNFPCLASTPNVYNMKFFNYAFVYTNYTANNQTTIIDNQQQIIDSQNDTNDLLNDDSTSESSSSANSFFNDFEVDDSKGITNIITAPIRFLEGLLTYNPNECSNLNFDLNMADDNISQTKALSLPCGSVLWSRVPSTVETTYTVFVWGLMAYRVLIGLVKFFNDTLNPEKDKEYWLDL